jgi:hypothetical protein
VLYGLGLFIFLLFFFGQYLLAWAQTQSHETTVRVGVVRANPQLIIGALRNSLRLNGTAETYAGFIQYQASIVMIVLALAGAVLIGNDLRYGSLPFYLSKPMSRWHYLLGKGLAVAVFMNLLTTAPALVLFVQYGLLDSYSYFVEEFRLLLGILGYGLVLTVSVTLLLLATATWLRRTVPLIMAWVTLFSFMRFLTSALVDGIDLDVRWRLLDLWNCTYLVGAACLGMDRSSLRPRLQPEWYEALAVLVVVCLLCLAYLVARIRAAEVVTR